MKKGPVSGYIGQHRVLKDAAARVGEYNRMLKTLQAAMPPEVAQSCVGAAWADGALILGVTSAAAATRIRYAAPELREVLARAGWEATAILPRVQASMREQKPIRAKGLKMNGAACDAFEALADSVKDENLAKALLTLVKHQRR
jgi:hypothetical protein